MPMKERPADPSRTVLTISVGFIVLYLVTGWKWSIITALAIGAAGVFSTHLSTGITFVWMKLSWLLGLIIPNLLLAVIYYFFLYPVAILSRLFGKKDPLNLKDGTESTFVTVDRKTDKKTFEKTW